MEFTSAAAAQRYDAVVRRGHELAVGLDFDGTLAPIVDDPEAARIHPDAPEVLVALAREVRAVAVVTGRPAGQVLDLGDLAEVGDRISGPDRELYVLGQYGNERWTSSQRRVISPRPPAGLASFLRELPGLLRETGVDPWVEEKGLAVAVHTRRLEDPQGAFDVLQPVLSRAAERHGLTIEPGRHVLEVRAPGMHKGLAMRQLLEEVEAGAACFAGDDLGDLEAYAELGRMREAGMPTLLVCSSSDEESALLPLADVVVDGPDGTLELLRQLARDIHGAG